MARKSSISASTDQDGRAVNTIYGVEGYIPHWVQPQKESTNPNTALAYWGVTSRLIGEEMLSSSSAAAELMNRLDYTQKCT